MVIDDFKREDGTWAKSSYIFGRSQATKSYSVWSGMLARCRVGGSKQHENPTYIGCTLSEPFSDFQTFTDWHILQVGYAEQNYHLDKDILLKGNRAYSQDVCVLVPQALNNFLTDSRKSRGVCPQGVYWHTRDNKYIAKINICGKQWDIGRFNTSPEASAAYKVAKEAEAYRWYERLRDGEFVVDPRVIGRMRTWTFEESV